MPSINYTPVGESISVDAKRTSNWLAYSDPRIPDAFLVSFIVPGQSAESGLINPTTFKESTTSEYSKRPVLGLSHSVVQYIRTESRKIQMEIWMSAHILALRGNKEVVSGSGFSKPAILKLRNFFEGLLVPQGYGQAPATVEVRWPGADLAFIGVLESMNTEYERFTKQGIPIEYKMDLSFMEVASDLMTRAPVDFNGLGYAAYAQTPRPPATRYKTPKISGGKGGSVMSSLDKARVAYEAAVVRAAEDITKGVLRSLKK